MKERFVIINNEGLYWNGGYSRDAKWVADIESVSSRYTFKSVSDVRNLGCAGLRIGESIKCVAAFD